MPLPSIHLANLHSLPNKTDELLLSCLNKDFSNSAALCFMETWLNSAIPDSALHLPKFQLIRSDRDAESTGKSRGGGTCFYINESWCTDVTVLKKMCCSDLEMLFINCISRSTHRGSSISSSSWVSTVLCKRTWAQLYRNLLIWSQTQNNNTLTLF